MSALSRVQPTLTRPAFRVSTINSIVKSFDRGRTQDINVMGLVVSKRKSKNVSFIKVCDGSTLSGLQCVLDANNPANEILGTIGVGSSVNLKGKLVRSIGSQQSCELHVDNLSLVGQADASEYPMQKKRHSLEFMRSNSHLRGRTALFQAITRIRNGLTTSAHKVFQENEFINVHTPILTGNDCEGAGEVFQVTSSNSDDFFKRPAFLTVSSQLHLEMAIGGFSRVYTLSPCFRADPGSEESIRHLAEFYMLEAEWVLPDNPDEGLSELTDFTETVMKEIVGDVSNNYSEEIDYLTGETVARRQMRKRSPNTIDLSLVDRIDILKSSEYDRITYSDAFDLIRNSGKKFKSRLTAWGQPLQTEHERFICEHVGESKRPVFVTHYPTVCKSFYMKPSQGIPQTVACFDLLIPGLGELVGGSVREESHQALRDKLNSLNITDLDWYLDTRKYGTMPHGGFGLGFDRLIMYLTGMENIRDVVQVGRWKTNIAY